MENKIYIIGIGPGSSEYLTKKAIDTVKSSDYTVGSTRAIDLFDDVNNKIAFNVKDLLDKLEKGVDLAIEGNTVSILSTGDPGFSGVLNTVSAGASGYSALTQQANKTQGSTGGGWK